MANDFESKLKTTEDVETLELENVWTTGRKFLISITIAVLILIASGIFSIYYYNHIVATHRNVVDKTFALKVHGLMMTAELNRHKASIATFLRTKEAATKTQVTDVRSKLLDYTNNLKLMAETNEDEETANKISEKLNYALDYGNKLIEASEAEEKQSASTPANISAVEPIMEEPVIKVEKPAPKPKPKPKPKPEPEPEVELDLGMDDLDLNVDDIDLGLEDMDLDIGDVDLGLDEDIDLSVEDDDLNLGDDIDLSVDEDLLNLDELNVDEVSDKSDAEKKAETNGDDFDLDFDLANEAFGGGIMGEGGMSTMNMMSQELRDYDLAIMELLDIINIDLIEKKNKKLKEQEKSLETDFFLAKLIVISLLVFLIFFNFGQYFYFNRSITQPIKRLRRYLISMGKGELPEFKMKVWKDDIGEMVRAVKNLLQGLKQTAFFANELGHGNLEADYTPLSSGDILGNSLMEMRNNLRQVADDDEKRNWANSGVAEFSEILRRYNDNLDNLADQIIMYLVNYLKVNQGGIFLLNDINKNDIHLELAAIYAWDRKKFVEERIEKGQGLVGQCWYEQQTIFMTDVPEEFVKITSGLGEATPRCILIVPLISNEEIYGVLELASFKTLEDYEVEFVEKVAESIAAAVSNVKITEKTKTLLEEAQQQGEELRANEEEMRQNMEEMNATQEEMDRILQEKDVIIETLKKELKQLKGSEG